MCRTDSQIIRFSHIRTKYKRKKSQKALKVGTHRTYFIVVHSKKINYRWDGARVLTHVAPHTSEINYTFITNAYKALYKALFPVYTWRLLVKRIHLMISQYFNTVFRRTVISFCATFIIIMKWKFAKQNEDVTETCEKGRMISTFASRYTKGARRY